jgi:rod shape-determining protein MreD
VILSPGAFLRMGALLLLTLVVQLSSLGHGGALGGHIDLIPLVVAAVAYYAGSVAGCTTGFAMGFLIDLAVGQTMGASSLVLTAIGYGVGRYREIRDPSHSLLPIAIGAAATAGWVVAYAAVSFMLDIGATISPGVIGHMLLTVLLGAVLALPVFAVDPCETRRRRRPPRETGPLGLRGLEV